MAMLLPAMADPRGYVFRFRQMAPRGIGAAGGRIRGARQAAWRPRGVRVGPRQGNFPEPAHFLFLFGCRGSEQSRTHMAIVGINRAHVAVRIVVLLW